MVLLISSSCCLLGPWRSVPLPAADGLVVAASWTAALRGALFLLCSPPECPPHAEHARRWTRPLPPAPVSPLAAVGWLGRPLLGDCSPHAAAGPPRWLCPLEGKRAPHKRGGAAAPAPQSSAPLLPRSSGEDPPWGGSYRRPERTRGAAVPAEVPSGGCRSQGPRGLHPGSGDQHFQREMTCMAMVP